MKRCIPQSIYFYLTVSRDSFKMKNITHLKIPLLDVDFFVYIIFKFVVILGLFKFDWKIFMK